MPDVVSRTASKMTITGTGRLGATLTAAAIVTQSDTVVSYQWVETQGQGGLYQVIPGATGSSYVVG